MTPTEEIETWISEHGNVRDALNVALARLKDAYARGRQAGLEEASNFVACNDCANCLRALIARPASKKLEAR